MHGLMIWLLGLAGLAAAGRDPRSTVLNRWPMVMAHDAATGYLPGGTLHPINNWAKTQAGGLGRQLTCGARALDLRPSLAAGRLQMHHGDMTVPVLLADALAEVVAWAGADGTGPDELVVLAVSHCSGDGCAAAVAGLFGKHGIEYVTECSQLDSLTVAEASAKARLPGGGAVLAVSDCWASNWDPSITCAGMGSLNPFEWSELSGSLSTAELEAAVARSRDGWSELDSGGLTYSCYKDSSSRQEPLDRMLSYINRTLQAGPSPGGQMYAVQALWQESADSVVVGELHGSSLIEDEQRSGLNGMVTQLIREGRIPTGQVNMVELNNVCDGGLELLAALRALD